MLQAMVIRDPPKSVIQAYNVLESEAKLESEPREAVYVLEATAQTGGVGVSRAVDIVPTPQH